MKGILGFEGFADKLNVLLVGLDINHKRVDQDTIYDLGKFITCLIQYSLFWMLESIVLKRRFNLH